MKASITALIIAVIMFIYVYKPVEHEQHAESPTESSQMIPPADDIAVELPPKPIRPTEIKMEVKPANTVVDTETKAKQSEKPIYKRETQTKVQAESKSEQQAQITVEATFYTASCAGCSGITASGHDVRNTIYVKGYRVIATDPSIIPTGSVVNVRLANGQSFEALAADRGGAIKGRIIDVLVASKDEAYRLGRQEAVITIIKRGG